MRPSRAGEREKKPAAHAAPRSSSERWFVVGWAAAAMVLLWAALPPLHWWPLAWVAPAFLVPLVQASPLPGRRSIFWLWVVGVAYWLATLYFIPLPHPALWAGWIAMSAFLGIYLPMFVIAARAMHHITRVPLPLAIGLAWGGSEWVRATFMTGFGMAMLSHANFQVPVLLQLADLGGGSLISAFMAATAACWYLAVRPVVSTWARALAAPKALIPSDASDNNLTDPSVTARLVHLGVGLLIPAFMVGYGAWRLSGSTPDSPLLRVAIIQGSIDTTFPDTAEERAEVARQTFEQYLELSRRAHQQWPDLDLMIWPEGKFPALDVLPPDTSGADESEGSGTGPLGPQQLAYLAAAKEQVERAYQIIAGILPWSVAGADNARAQRAATDGSTAYERPAGFPLLAGAQTWDIANDRWYNSGLLIDPRGAVVQRYLKNHLVMFGEYIPLQQFFPMLGEMTPIGQGLSAGQRGESFQVDEWLIAPSICFESTVAHVLLRHYHQLAAEDRPPDLLVNLTDDGWFFGTSCLDLHLACNVMRAVELRRPMVVAANTGFSAHIDGDGRILQRGPRRDTDVLLAEVTPDHRASVYASGGYWFGPISGGMVVFALFATLWRSRRRASKNPVADRPAGLGEQVV